MACALHLSPLVHVRGYFSVNGCFLWLAAMVIYKGTLLKFVSVITIKEPN